MEFTNSSGASNSSSCTGEDASNLQKGSETNVSGGGTTTLSNGNPSETLSSDDLPIAQVCEELATGATISGSRHTTEGRETEVVDNDRESQSDDTEYDEADEGESEYPDIIHMDEAMYDEYYEGLSPEQIAPKFYDWRECFPELQTLLDNFDTLVNEMRECTTRWTPWPETNLYSTLDQNGDWKVVPFVHTFPAYDESRTSWVEPNVAKCPETCRLLKNIPGIRTALYSRLGPDTKLATHRGWADLANHVLRIHLTLVAPSVPDSCGVWVEGRIQHHAVRQFIVFDDSKLHMAFNESLEEDRVVLIFDIMRPKSIPIGRAKGGHTDQLDAFIEQYQASLGL